MISTFEIITTALKFEFSSKAQSFASEMPLEYYDDMNYGFFADAVARSTGMHPAACLATYATIEPFIDKDLPVSLKEITNRIKNHWSSLTGEGRELAIKRHGLDESALSLETHKNAEAIMKKLPQSLASIAKFATDYALPEKAFIEHPHLKFKAKQRDAIQRNFLIA